MSHCGAIAPTVLVLGGTAEARALADALGGTPPGRARRGGASGGAEPVGLRVVTSLAGRVARPRLPEHGEVRVGGFGGVDGLVAWLRAHHVAAAVDATHPFAERIGANAALAAPRAGVPLLRLARPGWTERPGDRWHRVANLAAAADLVPRLGTRAFLTTGRQGLAAFAGDTRTAFLVRTVDPPQPADLPPRHILVLDRGPYTVEGETALIDRHRVDVVVTKDSGGALTAAKLDAARVRSLPVVVVERPPRPAGVPEVADVAAAAAWTAERVAQRVATQLQTCGAANTPASSARV